MTFLWVVWVKLVQLYYVPFYSSLKKRVLLLYVRSMPHRFNGDALSWEDRMMNSGIDNELTTQVI